MSKETRVNVNPVAAEFTLNTICETAMGVKLGNSAENKNYRASIHDIGTKLIFRATRPWLRNKSIYKFFGYQKEFEATMASVNKFTNDVIQTRREKILDGNFQNYFHESDENV